MAGYVYIDGTTGVEDFGGTRAEFPSYGEGTTTVCVAEGCGVPSISAENQANGAFFELYAYTNAAEPSSAEMKFNTSSVQIVQEKGPSASIDTTDSLFGAAPNGAFPGQWVKGSSGKVGFTANDPGIGISSYSFTSPQESKWGSGPSLAGCNGVQCDECWNWASKCEAGHSSSNEPIVGSLGGLPDGKDTIDAKVKDATGLSAEASGTVDVDSTPPHGLALVGLPSNKEIGEGTYHFKAEAADGEGSIESSGIASISLYVDGQPLTNPVVKCSPGPCAAKGEWSINGFATGIGNHTITVVATDNAGNVATSSVPLTVHRASPIGLGPGTIYPQSGELTLHATDVSLDLGLSVSRSYGSRHLTSGVLGPLGPQWGFSLGGEESLVKQPNGSMVLTPSTGSPEIFATNEKAGSSRLWASRTSRFRKSKMPV